MKERGEKSDKEAIVSHAPQARPMPRWCLSKDYFGQATFTAAAECKILW